MSKTLHFSSQQNLKKLWKTFEDQQGLSQNPYLIGNYEKESKFLDASWVGGYAYVAPPGLIYNYHLRYHKLDCSHTLHTILWKSHISLNCTHVWLCCGQVAFYNYILILPCVLLSSLTLVLFWLPPESPAKMVLGTSLGFSRVTSFPPFVVTSASQSSQPIDRVPLLDSPASSYTTR